MPPICSGELPTAGLDRGDADEAVRRAAGAFLLRRSGLAGGRGDCRGWAVGDTREVRGRPRRQGDVDALQLLLSRRAGQVDREGGVGERFGAARRAAKPGAKGRAAIVFAQASPAGCVGEGETAVLGAAVGRPGPGGHRVRGHVGPAGRRAGQGRFLAAVELDLDRVERQLRRFPHVAVSWPVLWLATTLPIRRTERPRPADSASRKIRYSLPDSGSRFNCCAEIDVAGQGAVRQHRRIDRHGADLAMSAGQATGFLVPLPNWASVQACRLGGGRGIEAHPGRQRDPRVFHVRVVDGGRRFERHFDVDGGAARRVGRLVPGSAEVDGSNGTLPQPSGSTPFGSGEARSWDPARKAALGGAGAAMSYSSSGRFFLNRVGVEIGRVLSLERFDRG